MNICKCSEEEYDEGFEIDPYVVSFTSSYSSEKMWKEFGDDSEGIALEFDCRIIATCALKDRNPDIFLKCFYSEKEEVIKDWLINTRKNIMPWESDALQDDLMMISTLLLKNRFADEMEIRYTIPFIKPILYFHDGVILEPDKNEKIEDTKNLYFPKEALTGLYFGKNIDDEDYHDSLQYLKSVGYDVESLNIIRMNHT